MFGIHDYWMFVAAAVFLILTPGQDTVYIAGRSISHGYRIGVVSAFGVATGALIHVVAATLGLSAILATSAAAFAVLKWAGVAYLVYLGIQLWRSDEAFLPVEGEPRTRVGSRQAFHRGVLSSLLNPKVAVFFLAFLPQFVDPSNARRSLGLLTLGGTFVTMGTVWCLVIATVAARASDTIRRSEKAVILIRHATGALFVGLGIWLALARPH
jgi:threonine/homoserine/homoserine lactone efflux protein